MGSFEVNPHSLRTAARVFAVAEGDVGGSAGRFLAGAGDAGAAMGDEPAARAYAELYGAHREALDNLRGSLRRISAALLAAADGYAASDDDRVITGQERP